MGLREAISRYCNYQERSHFEVRNKLYELGASAAEVNAEIADLIERALLNEERFACAFVRGKFSIKKWGRIKIIYHLKKHYISDYLLKKALSEINSNEYFQTGLSLARQKRKALGAAKKPYDARNKIYLYLQQKGFEPSIIREIIQTIMDME